MSTVRFDKVGRKGRERTIIESRSKGNKQLVHPKCWLLLHVYSQRGHNTHLNKGNADLLYLYS